MAPLAFVDTYGCQQNERTARKSAACSQKWDTISRRMKQRGPDRHKHLRGQGARRDARTRQRRALVAFKKSKAGIKKSYCGCMVQQEHVAEK